MFKRWSDQKYKEKLTLSIRKMCKTPEWRKKVSLGLKKLYKNHENNPQWKGGTGNGSKYKYPNSPVWQYAKQFNMTFKEAAQEFREVCNEKIK